MELLDEMCVRRTMMKRPQRQADMYIMQSDQAHPTMFSTSSRFMLAALVEDPCEDFIAGYNSHVV